VHFQLNALKPLVRQLEQHLACKNTPQRLQLRTRRNME